MRMSGGFRQDIPDDAFGQSAGSLILLYHDGYFLADTNVGSRGSLVHLSPSVYEFSLIITRFIRLQN
jgi:hypothetical protein